MVWFYLSNWIEVNSTVITPMLTYICMYVRMYYLSCMILYMEYICYEQYNILHKGFIRMYVPRYILYAYTVCTMYITTFAVTALTGAYCHC